MAISLLAYLVTFLEQLYFRRGFIFGETLFSKKLLLLASLEQLLRHNSYLFGAAISSEQLLFLRCSIFERVIFLQQLLFSEYLFFRSKTSTEKPLLENRKLFRAVTFWNSYIFGGRIT